MSEGAVGLMILLGCAVVASVAFHLCVRCFAMACFLSGMTASVVLTVLDTLRRGYPDKFVLIALVFGAFWGVLVSAVVGGALRIFERWGRKRAE